MAGRVLGLVGRAGFVLATGTAVGLTAVGYWAKPLIATDVHEALLAPAVLSRPFTRQRRYVGGEKNSDNTSLSSSPPISAAAAGKSDGALSWDLYQAATALYSASESDGSTAKSSDGENPSSLLRRIKDPVVFIAPPSFVSSRAAFLGMAELACDAFVVTETPGYGANGLTSVSAKELSPAALTARLETLLEDVQTGLLSYSSSSRALPSSGSSDGGGGVGGGGLTVVAAGHAAPYVADICARRPGLISRVVLLNPTMRGPLPSARAGMESSGKGTAARVMGSVIELAWTLYQVPLFGDGMHFCANTGPNIEHQLRSHVFIDEASISAEAIQHNLEFSRTGAHLPKGAFLTGRADTPEASWASACQALAAKQSGSVLVGSDSPENTQAALPAARSAGLPFAESPGALRSFEEFPEPAAKQLVELLLQKEEENK